MTDETNPILALIDKAVEEKTFSLDALKAVAAIKEEATRLAKTVELREREAKRLNIELTQANDRANAALKVVEEWKARRGGPRRP